MVSEHACEHAWTAAHRAICATTPLFFGIAWRISFLCGRALTAGSWPGAWCCAPASFRLLCSVGSAARSLVARRSGGPLGVLPCIEGRRLLGVTGFGRGDSHTPSSMGAWGLDGYRPSLLSLSGLHLAVATTPSSTTLSAPLFIGCVRSLAVRRGAFGRIKGAGPQPGAWLGGGARGAFVRFRFPGVKRKFHMLYILRS